MDKKGYFRTLEAIIAIVIIFIFILSILPKRETSESVPKEIELTAQQILNEIQNNQDYRTSVLDSTCEDYLGIRSFIEINIPVVIGFELFICDSGNCIYKNPDAGECKDGQPSEFSKEKELLNIYTRSLLIKGKNSAGNDMEKVIKLLLWRRV